MGVLLSDCTIRLEKVKRRLAHLQSRSCSVQSSQIYQAISDALDNLHQNEIHFLQYDRPFYNEDTSLQLPQQKTSPEPPVSWNSPLSSNIHTVLSKDETFTFKPIQNYGSGFFASTSTLEADVQTPKPSTGGMSQQDCLSEQQREAQAFLARTSGLVRRVAGRLRQQLFQAEEEFEAERARLEAHWPWLVPPARGGAAPAQAGGPGPGGGRRDAAPARGARRRRGSSSPPSAPAPPSVWGGRGAPRLPDTEEVVMEYARLVQKVLEVINQWRQSTSQAVLSFNELNILLRQQKEEVLGLYSSLSTAFQEYQDTKEWCIAMEQLLSPTNALLMKSNLEQASNRTTPRSMGSPKGSTYW